MTKRRRRKPLNERMRVTIDDSKIVAVVDTNVFLELYSWHDTAEAAKNEPDTLDYRYGRAGDALRMAIYFDKRRAITWGLREAFDKLAILVPPSNRKPDEPPVEMDVNLAYTMTFIWFVKDKVLSRWLPVTHNVEKKQVTSGAADLKLLRKAKKLGIPLITNEGHNHKKPKLKKNSLRVLAPKAGVKVFTPGEFVGDRVKDRDIKAFFDRFNKYGPKFLEGTDNYKNGQALLKYMLDFYLHALNVSVKT